MIRALPYDADARPDLARVLAIAAAIAVHTLAFLLLLLPLATPRFAIEAKDPPPQRRWITVEPPVTPPPPRQVEVVRPEQPRPRTPPHTIAPPQPQVPDAVAATSDQGLLPADPAIEALPAVPDVAPAGGVPLQGAHLQYERAPPPPYPRAALSGHAEGTVVLRILVDTDGSPLEVAVERGSGHRVLDEAARRHVLRYWRFKPAVDGGRPVQAYGLVPIDFRLQ